MTLHNRIETRFFWFFMVLIGANLSASFAQPPTYALSQHKGAKQTTVRVYDRRTKRTIWKHTYLDAGEFTWSRDRRAFAFVTSRTMKDPGTDGIVAFHIYTWRAGEQVRLQPSQPYRGQDCVEFLRWSPDNQRLLISVGGSGGCDEEMGQLWCLNLNTGKAQLVTNLISSLDMKPRWHGSHEIIYRRVFFFFDKHHHSYDIVSKKNFSFHCS